MKNVWSGLVYRGGCAGKNGDSSPRRCILGITYELPIGTMLKHVIMCQMAFFFARRLAVQQRLPKC